MASRRSAEWRAWVESVCSEHNVGSRKDGGKFEPHADDAFKLAALQWWTHTIGKTLIEVYATDRRQYRRMSQIMGDATAALHSLVGDGLVGGEQIACQTDEDCPRGYYCRDGTCEPLDAGEMPPE